MEAFFLLLATTVAWIYREPDWKVFLFTTLLCVITGHLGLLFHSEKKQNRMSRADNFMVVSLTWIFFSIFGAIPYVLLLHMDVASAFYETMSGFTTTGATLIDNIDEVSHSLKFWRSLTQWMGGLGIVVFSLALIPAYEMKNSNIYSAEVTGIGLDKLRPKIGDTARQMLLIYVILTTLCAILYWVGPMDIFDAICHSMTTISTGGFSTHAESIDYYHSSWLEYVCSIFMILSSINFALYYYLSIGRTKSVLENEELRTFLGIVAGSVLLFFLLFELAPFTPTMAEKLPVGIEDTFRTALFHVSTNITSTGFSASYFDSAAWGAHYWMITIFIMILGGCAGSTAGGMKIVRLIICVKSVLNEFILQIHPRAVLGVRLNGRIVSEERVRKTLAFVFLYVILVMVGMTLLNLMGCDTYTAFGSCINMLSNVGSTTGLPELPASGKWLMSFYMLVGRLEFFTVLFLFLPSYWKQKK